MGELLGALGLAWPRLLLYPGGLFALGASWLLARWLRWCAGRPGMSPRPPAPIDIIDIVPPLVVLTLLPLAPARGFPYGLDLAVAMGMLEWPRLRQAAGNARARAGLLRAYGPLVLAALLMAEASRGLGLSGLLTWPEVWADRALLLGGAGLWLVALPSLLADGQGELTGRLRALGLLLVGALPLTGALAAWVGDLLPGALSGWIIPPATLVGAALALGGLLYVRRSQWA